LKTSPKGFAYQGLAKYLTNSTNSKLGWQSLLYQGIAGLFFFKRLVSKTSDFFKKRSMHDLERCAASKNLEEECT